jgi:integrase
MKRNERHPHQNEKQAYDNLLKVCLSSDAHQDEKKLAVLTSQFTKKSQDLHQQVAKFKDNLATIPLAVFILLWAESFRNDRVFGNRYLAMLSDLIEAGLLPLISTKKKTILLQDLALQDPSLMIETIRCYKDWSIPKREDYVQLYQAFSKWLSDETFGYVPEAKDVDRIASQKRQIPFETYIEILNCLDLREQILAKMFYLGGQRALEEVLSVKIEDIDFKNATIQLLETVFYPRHLFDDILRYMQDRKKGCLFIGRIGERMAHTTPFRALKRVVSELKLDPEFTFKEFTKNI